MANCLINNFSIMYKFKQDLAMAYFPDHSKESASKRFAHEIHSNKPLLAAPRPKGTLPPIPVSGAIPPIFSCPVSYYTYSS